MLKIIKKFSFMKYFFEKMRTNWNFDLFEYIGQEYKKTLKCDAWKKWDKMRRKSKENE